MRIGAGVESLAPHVIGNNPLENVDAVIEMNQVDIGIRTTDGLIAAKEATRVTAAADEPGKANDSHAKFSALPEPVFYCDQRMIEGLLAIRLAHELAIGRIDRRGADE